MKKETLEEAARRNHNEQKLNTYTPYSFNDAFKDGAKWQAERMYSEEEVTKLLISCKDRFGGSDLYDYTHDNQVKKWFESYKKEQYERGINLCSVY